VKWIIDDSKCAGGLRILDIGTGSGCIIISIGDHLKDALLTATDISPDAIRTAKGNADKYNVEVIFFRHDILRDTHVHVSGPFDIIVSNPPYIRDSEKAQMMRNVLDYEPGTALFVPDNDPLVFYRAITGFAKKTLVPGGELFLEINENLGEETVGLLEAEGFRDILLRKDMQGKDRFIRCSL
jgi:release factor glutamine methyltransferase